MTEMEELVEKVKTAIRRDDGNNCISLQKAGCKETDGCVCLSLARAAIAAVQANAAIMPKEATVDRYDPSSNGHMSGCTMERRDDGDWMKFDGYTAMLAASPYRSIDRS